MPMISYGANVHALTASGFTALDAAQGFKHTSIRRPLGIDGGSSKQRFHRCHGVEWLVGKKFSYSTYHLYQNVYLTIVFDQT